MTRSTLQWPTTQPMTNSWLSGLGATSNLHAKSLLRDLEAGAGNLIGAKIRLSDNPPETVSNLPSVAYNPQRNEYLFCWQQQDLAFQVSLRFTFQIINFKRLRRGSRIRFN